MRVRTAPRERDPFPQLPRRVQIAACRETRYTRRSTRVVSNHTLLAFATESRIVADSTAMRAGFHRGRGETAGMLARAE